MHQKQRKSEQKSVENQIFPMILHEKKGRFSLKNRPFKSNASDISPKITLNYPIKLLRIIDKSMRIAKEFRPKPLLP
jgi:hypothetical protein